MRTDDFDFDLPEDLIALAPVTPRDAARMLVVHPGAEANLADRTVQDLPDLLAPGDVLVVNDTRVIPAALEGIRRRGDNESRIQANLVRRLSGDRWQAFARPGKRLAVGDRIGFGTGAGVTTCLMGALDATVVDKADGGLVELVFDLSGPALDAAIAGVGAMPLPPYIASRRAATDRDRIDYQTVCAARDGAVAAPTAALHFPDELLGRLEERGIARETVTLHVGAGTFLPVKSDEVADHQMHAEWGEISPSVADRLNAARARGGRVVAVGTTALRLLETAVDDGGDIRPFSGETDIFITPGFKFRAADILMTNFHLPRSTLFMLVGAFCGLETMRAAYAHAIAMRYRFYSYGDSSLLFRPATEGQA